MHSGLIVLFTVQKRTDIPGSRHALCAQPQASAVQEGHAEGEACTARIFRSYLCSGAMSRPAAHCADLGTAKGVWSSSHC